jgi:hypothetical protein
MSKRSLMPNRNATFELKVVVFCPAAAAPYAPGSIETS